jgi:hypothetical protein
MNPALPNADYTARARLFGGNRMKLGVMAFNCSHGSTITTVPEAWRLNWPDTVEIAQAVDRAGMEAVLPVGRWRGFHDPLLRHEFRDPQGSDFSARRTRPDRTP